MHAVNMESSWPLSYARDLVVKTYIFCYLLGSYHNIKKFKRSPKKKKKVLSYPADGYAHVCLTAPDQSHAQTTVYA